MQASKLQREIDENLKRAYNDVLQEDVPDKLLSLLDQLRSKDEGAASAANSERTND